MAAHTVAVSLHAERRAEDDDLQAADFHHEAPLHLGGHLEGSGAALEAHLGSKLMARSTRRLTLTSAGGAQGSGTALLTAGTVRR